jgi:hypothetical protein
MESDLERIMRMRFNVSQATEAIVAIECTDLLNVFGAQFKVEHLSVFRDSFGSDRFRNDNQSALNLEPNQHLSNRLFVLFTDLLQNRILQERWVACLSPRTIRGSCKKTQNQSEFCQCLRVRREDDVYEPSGE